MYNVFNSSETGAIGAELHESTPRACSKSNNHL